MRGAGPIVLAGMLLLAGAARSDAQRLPADAASAGLGGLDAATASGFRALAANPALLGFAPDGAASAGLSLSFGGGLEPVTLADVGEWNGHPVPAEVRASWLRRIVARGGERGGAAGRATPVAFAAGRWGVQLSTLASARVAINEDAAELVLFGNAPREGEGRTFDLEGSSLEARVVSTLALAWAGRPLPLRGGRLAVGATGKLVVGHALLLGEDAASTLGGDPLDVRFRFPLLSTSGGGFDRGTGLGLDVAAAWKRGGTTVAMVVRDAVNTFEWDVEAMVYRPGTALFDQEGSSSDFEARPASEAPEELREGLREAGFGPSLEIGIGHAVDEALLLMGSLALAGEGDGFGGGARVGAAAELGRWRRFPLRAHLAVGDDGWRAGGGATAHVGPIGITGAGWVGSGSSLERVAGALAISWWGTPRRGG